MLLSIGIILLGGMFAGWLFGKIKFPRLFGMILAGILFGPYVLNIIDGSVLGISGELRKIALIFAVLVFRAAGVFVCLIKTKLSAKERIFCVISYMPKATVQAAIGGLPLAMGLSCGNVVLTVSVLAILITAPLGAFGIDFLYKRMLEKE